MLLGPRLFSECADEMRVVGVNAGRIAGLLRRLMACVALCEQDEAAQVCAELV